MNDSHEYSLSILDLPPRLTGSELAETRVMRNHKHFSYNGFEFFREPTDAATDVANVFQVVVQSCAQVGKTSLIENVLAWVLRYRLNDCLLVTEAQKTAERISKKRIKPLLLDYGIAEIRKNMKDGEDKSKSVFNLSIGGGCSLIIGSSKSTSDLASMSIQTLFCDEVSRWETLKGEGDPLDLARQRTQQKPRPMTIITSTPTDPDSPITREYMLGTQERWGVKCGSCSEHFVVEWEKIDWTDKENPQYACPRCGEVFDEATIAGFEHCYSAPMNPEPLMDKKYGRICRSFWITAPNCPSQYTWKELKEYERAAISKGVDSMQSFTNTRLGVPWSRPDETRIEPEVLMRSCTLKFNADAIPTDIAFITCGIDTHDSCLYAHTVGFSEDMQRIYPLDYRVLVGDPDRPEVWESLNRVLDRDWIRADGRILKPAFSAQDAGGHRTDAVCMYSLRNPRFMPVRGYVSSNSDAVDPVLGSQQKYKLTGGVKTSVVIQRIGVNAVKDQLLRFEQLTIAGEQTIFVPTWKCFDMKYFCGLTSEIKVGSRWIAPAGGHTANEVSDTLVYAYAIAQYYQMLYYKTGRDREARVPRYVTDTEEVIMQKSQSAEKIEKPSKIRKSRKKAAETIDDTQPEIADAAVQNIEPTHDVEPATSAPEHRVLPRW